MKLPRFRLSQLLVLPVVVASTMAMVAYWNSPETIWRSKPLEFKSPVVPSAFSEKGRQSPEINAGKFTPTIKYESGSQLYHSCYRRGWQSCRKRFYDRSDLRELTNYDWDIVQSQSLTDEKWTAEHCNVAFTNGYLMCKHQIEHLLDQYPEDRLRMKLGYTRRWHAIPFGVTACVGLVALAVLRPHSSLSLIHI